MARQALILLVAAALGVGAALGAAACGEDRGGVEVESGTGTGRTGTGRTGTSPTSTQGTDGGRTTTTETRGR